MGRDEESDDAAQAATMVSPSHPTEVERSSRPTLGALAPGTSIGRYRLDKRLGAGAMGVVWAAQDPQLDRMVAIKVVHPNFVRAPEAASRFMREARAMAKVKDRAVVTIHDAGDVGDHLFIAMELVEGTTLGALLRERTPTELADWKRWLDLMIDAGRGLVAAHRAGILHRDFKPDNVLVDKDGRVCVGDFGLATLGEEKIATLGARWETTLREKELGVELTTTGALVGTPAYMSPQQLRSQAVDARADQFAFCVTTWEALYGARPFSTEKQGFDAVFELAEKIDTGVLPIAPPGSQVPLELRAILARGLAADPAARWPDLASLLAELERISHSRPTSMPVIDVTAGMRRHSSSPWRTLALSVAGLGACAAVAYLLLRGPKHAAPLLTPTATGPVAKQMFAVALRTGLALSPSGRYLALSNDRLQVRDVETSQLWSALLPGDDVDRIQRGVDEVSHIEIDEDSVRFAYRLGVEVWTWKFRTQTPPAVERKLPVVGGWLGSLTAGDLVFEPKQQIVGLYTASGELLYHWPSTKLPDEVTISPDLHRFAFLEDARFQSRIMIGDDRTGALISSPPLASPTSITFITSDTVMYATGTLELPKIWTAKITASGLGEPTEIYGLDTGWFGALRVHGRRIYALEMQPTPRTVIVSRDGKNASSQALDNASVSLGWVSPTEFLTWNRPSQLIERRAPASPVALTKAKLDGEPANATLSDGTVIAALRRADGREAVAVSLADGRVLWRHQDGRTFAVRCAGDAHPPCFAIRIADPLAVPKGSDELVTLVPATGELGTKALYRGSMEDLVVSADGQEILIAAKPAELVVLDAAGAVKRRVVLDFGGARSIAIDPQGGVLLGVTRKRNNFQVLHADTGAEGLHELEIVYQSNDDLLSLVRPSPTGSYVLALARQFTPELWQLEFPESFTSN